MTITVTFNDNCPDAIYPIVMLFDGQSVDSIDTNDLLDACKNRADFTGTSSSDIMNTFTRYVARQTT